MIKQFSAGDITIRPFKTFKNWSVQSITSGSDDGYGFNTYYNTLCEINEGKKLFSIFYPSSSAYYSSISEPVNPSGKYARNIYSLTDAMFYRNKGNFTELFGVESLVPDKMSGNKEVRTIHDRVVTLALNQNVFGEKIKPYSVQITDNSNPHETYNIKDDGYTNLYITGSHFSTYEVLGAVKNIYPRPFWDTGSVQFYLRRPDGSTEPLEVDAAKQYASIGMDVFSVGTPGYLYDTSSVVDIFQPENEHFGESVSSWYKYIAVGSSIDGTNLTLSGRGYASIFKYDDGTDAHRLIKKFDCPLTDTGFFKDFDVDNTFPYTIEDLTASASLFTNTFGHSVCVRDNFLAIGSPSGSICFDTGSYPGYVFVYDKYKGGTDNWGLINIIQGATDDDKFGYSVSLDNDILAVGAPNVSGSGAVYIYRRRRYFSNGCDNIETSSFWQTVAHEEEFCEEFETESGSYIIYSERTQSSGSLSGSYTWTYEALITSSVLAAGDNFGWCVAVDSGSLIVGTNKSGYGYAAIFTCSYYSASAGACPTASWGEAKILRRDTTYGDLDLSSQLYAHDVTSTAITTDGFGKSVAISERNMVVGCLRDKAFVPYASYTGSASILGSAYFYRHMYLCDVLGHHKVLKTFGDRQYPYNNNFGRAVSIGGTYGAVSSWSDKIGRSVDYFNGQYIIEDHAYQATSSEDPNGVLGRVTMYRYNDVTVTWELDGIMRRNKQAYKPANIYGYSLCVCSDFMVVGAPVVNIAVPAATASIYDPNNIIDFPANYSGSVYVYNLGKYEESPLIGNVFYKNGYFVLTNTASNYYNIFTGTGSHGFDLSYQGSHTIYEHEHLISVRPGEFNYSTNPSSLQKSDLLFDVNRDGVFDFMDVDLIMRYLFRKKFFEEFVFDDNGIILDQNSTADNSWWGDELLQLESEDVLMQEGTGSAALYASSSFNVFTKTAYDYIEEKLVNTGILDIDGDGNINVNDGAILSLYYLDRLVPQRLTSLLSKTSTRKYVKDIKDYLNPYCKTDNYIVNPHFLSYQYSSSYDPTGSYLAPFITTIGLYEGNELVAVGKLGRPVKNLVDWPINIVVRFDT
jgi:hypothetical protein